MVKILHSLQFQKYFCIFIHFHSNLNVKSFLLYSPQGHTVLNLTTPHSITTWETDAFCLGRSGFGETSGVGLTTFQPYFIDLILPYSVVQGEKLTITAYVFSYIKACMMVWKISITWGYTGYCGPTDLLSFKAEIVVNYSKKSMTAHGWPRFHCVVHGQSKMR